MEKLIVLFPWFQHISLSILTDSGPIEYQTSVPSGDIPSVVFAQTNEVRFIMRKRSKSVYHTS